MTKFFMTYGRSRPDSIVPWFEENDVPVMTNAANRWSEAKEHFLDPWQYDTEKVIDSGGYNVQANYGEYPWSVERYHYWLHMNQEAFEWAAVMDYACEERFDEMQTVEERIEWTVENTVEHFNLDPEYKVLPVLQGRSIEDYVRSYDMLKDRGIPVEHVGLGTVCRISSTQEIVETEQAIRERCPDIESIHGFGVKIDAFKMGAQFESADSQAWVWAASHGEKYVLGHDGFNYKLESVACDNSKERTIESFQNYYAYVNKIIDGEISAPYAHND